MASLALLRGRFCALSISIALSSPLSWSFSVSDSDSVSFAVSASDSVFFLVSVADSLFFSVSVLDLSCSHGLGRYFFLDILFGLFGRWAG